MGSLHSLAPVMTNLFTISISEIHQIIGLVWAISLLFVGLFSLASSSGTERSASVGVTSRDVCIIGGGAAGTYAAVRLSDLGQSVVVVEK